METGTDMVPAVAATHEAPLDLVRWAGEAASATKQIVVATAITIQGRKYVRVEGWQAIALAHGCVASARDVERTETGYRAIGEVRRIRDGVVLATAEGFVGDDEKTWASRNEFARRAMAQTRAISRACRSCFAHVVVMMQAGLETTPAEEMEAAVAHEQRPAPRPVEAQRVRPEKPSAGKTITREQYDAMVAEATQLGVTPDRVREIIGAFGYERAGDLPAAKFRQVLEEIRASAPAIEVEEVAS